VNKGVREFFFDPLNIQRATGAIDTTITLSLLNPQFSASSGHKYFSFDLGLSDSTNSIYFVNASAKIKFDTLTFGKRLKLNGKISVSRSTLLLDSITFKNPVVTDNSDDGFTLTITVNNPAINPVIFPDLSTTPSPAIHVKMEIADCSHFSTIDLVAIDSLFVGDYTDHAQTGPFSLTQYDTTYIDSNLSFLGCDILYIDSIWPSTANAGVGDTITIYGDGFGGPSRGSGNVFLRDANYAGNVYLHLDSLDYIEWTNTRIKFVLPSLVDSSSTHNNKPNGTPGSGIVAIKNDGGDSLLNPNHVLTIFYGVTNVITSNPLRPKDLLILSPIDSSTMKREFNFRPDKSFSDFPDRLACLDAAIKQWVCLTTVNYKLGADTLSLDTIEKRDNVNLVTFGNSKDTSVLAYTKTWAYFSGGSCNKTFTSEVDIVVNKDLIPEFFTDTNRLVPVPAGKYDLFQVLLHELGHAHSLTHVNNPSAIMFRSASNLGIPDTSRKIRLYNDQSAIAGGSYVMDKSRSFDTIVCPVIKIMEMGTQNCVGVIGITEIASPVSNIAVFPNPTSKNINVLFDLDHRAKVQISLFDLYGRKYYHDDRMIEQGIFRTELLMDDYASGIYLLRISAGNSSSIRKIIKQ